MHWSNDIANSSFREGKSQGMAQGTINTIINFIHSGIPQDEAFRIAEANDSIKQEVLKALEENKGEHY